MMCWDQVPKVPRSGRICRAEDHDSDASSGPIDRTVRSFEAIRSLSCNLSSPQQTISPI